ncbi:hypothetical protein [Paenibacillus sp. 7516]|uniref:hypothetical protein n=1 Tax=Paenibacillus sp. 7516 TaxID=2022549 RepID=UPI001BB06CA2|nr:hypothetical protein [Paenibacillus sp. 7516]
MEKGSVTYRRSEMDRSLAAVIPGFLDHSFSRRKSGAKGERFAPLTDSIPPLHVSPLSKRLKK